MSHPAIGRFAPSPTGPLHLGHLITAITSYCSVRQKKGEWLLRIDDIDSDRSSKDSANLIIRTIRNHGMIPDRDIIYQSSQQTKYRHHIRQLTCQTFSCSCSRRQTSAHKTCQRDCYQRKTPLKGHSIRLRAHKTKILFKSSLSDANENNFNLGIDDFVLRRKNGDISYQLASAVDDGGHVTEVVRGDDLLTSTSYQIFLMKKLGLSVPNYKHIPCLRFESGEKLSSQNMAPALEIDQPTKNLRNALWYLGMFPPRALHSIPSLIQWTIEHLNLAQLPKQFAPFQNYDVTNGYA